METIVLPRRKDDTDTMFAVKEALRRGVTDCLLIGVVGARFDHSFANVSILLYLTSRGARGRIIDDYSEIHQGPPRKGKEQCEEHGRSDTSKEGVRV